MTTLLLVCALVAAVSDVLAQPDAPVDAPPILVSIDESAPEDPRVIVHPTAALMVWGIVCP